MRYVFTLEQRDFFNKNQHIEFAGLIPPATIAEINHKGTEIFTARLASCTPYKAGFDLWRESKEIKLATQKLSIAHIASELFATTPLRIAFDQLCLAKPNTAPFSEALSLNQISSIKPLAGALILLLEGHTTALPLSPTPGNALFISPDFPIPWPELYATPHLKFFIVAFAPKKSRYVQEPKDPHSPQFKKMGYAYNAYLQEATHPILFGKK